MADNLSFYNMISTQNMASGAKWIFDTENHHDTGNYDGYYKVEFYLWSKDLKETLNAVYIIQTKYDAKGNVVK